MILTTAPDANDASASGMSIAKALDSVSEWSDVLARRAPKLDSMNQPALQENVANCDQEPIHALGLIQPHGALLCFSADGVLLAQSSNAVGLLGPLPAPGASLDVQHLDEGARDAIRQALTSKEAQLDSFEWMSARGDCFDIVMHWSADALVVEFEQIALDAPSASQFALYSQRAIQRLQTRQYANVTELLQETAQAFRAMTGFDRVMGYRFLADGSGEVVAEARREDMPSYLQQRYPAGDIPAQARRLYILNPIRQITSVSNNPVAIVPHFNPNTNAAWDLSHSVLRSVSPVHIEYLRNMGVRASMSVSIIVDDKLWGLFACHHLQSHRASHAVRLSCTVLTQVVSILISQIEARQRVARDHHSQRLATQITAHLTDADDLAAGLVKASPQIVSLVKCERAFAVVDHEVSSLCGASAVGRQELIALAEYMATTRTDVLATDCWNNKFDSLEAIPGPLGPAAGCLAIQIGGDARVTIIWLRDELVQTIKWAGPFDKIIASGPNGPRLTPRGSFEVWKQIVRGTSKAWSDADQRAVRELKTILQDIAFQRMQEAERARTTLLATLGHDLRNPLQTINVAMQLMGRGLANSADTARRVEGSTRRMQSLINYILDVSRIRSGLGLGMSRQLVSLKEVIESTVEDNRLAHPGVTISTRLDNDLGEAYVDPDRFGQALTNLISNARQHGDNTYPIEVTGGLESGKQVIEISNRLRERPTVAFERLIDPFKSGSLNNLNNRGGLGLGLFIANAILKGHDSAMEGRFEQDRARIIIRLEDDAVRSVLH